MIRNRTGNSAKAIFNMHYANIGGHVQAVLLDENDDVIPVGPQKLRVMETDKKLNLSVTVTVHLPAGKAFRVRVTSQRTAPVTALCTIKCSPRSLWPSHPAKERWVMDDAPLVPASQRISRLWRSEVTRGLRRTVLHHWLAARSGARGPGEMSHRKGDAGEARARPAKAGGI
ncbi:hypothetical protein MIND_01303800 [Mycena indigotica]|uniref:Uncharacterized protein n=1 Tax=Mycena indigotica TaxID=2126181 RepID=A0A8H6S243_9AGAR|nr:uncharacterized protein MIND_01303800 [Mycena indigotica]KAF7290636.1 hypothetical protein MIND_01303800 [Mycena indigotica]